MLRSLFLAVVLFLLALSGARADEVEVIQLRHRMAEQLIPTLQPLVEPGGAVTGMQSSLIVRSSRRNIEDLKRVIAALDTVPRRLLISVRQDMSGSFDRRAASVSGTIGTQDAHGKVRILDSASAIDDRNVSQVQAVEGSPAYIAVGQSVPVTTSTVTQSYGGTMTQSSTAYRDIQTGFSVVPRVAGDRVTLEIAPQRETPGAYGRGSANTQQIVTTATGRLGEWIELGSMTQTTAAEGSGILSSRSAARRDNRGVWVKVDEIK